MGIPDSIPGFQSEPGLFYFGIDAIEWTAFTADGGLDDWHTIDEYCDLLCRLVPQMKTPGASIPKEVKSVLLTHRLSLKTIYSGYSKSYVSAKVDRDYSYSKLELEAIDGLCTACSRFKDGKPNWKDGLKALRAKLTSQASRIGVPLGILLRLRADVNEIISKDSFSFPERTEEFKTHLETAFDKDEMDDRCNGLVLGPL